MLQSTPERGRQPLPPETEGVGLSQGLQLRNDLTNVFIPASSTSEVDKFVGKSNGTNWYKKKRKS